jgi:thiol:disulfide interchange protein DsbD
MLVFYLFVVYDQTDFAGKTIREQKFMIHHKRFLLFFLSLFILGLIVPSMILAQTQAEFKLPLKVQLQTYPPKVSPGQEVWLAATLTLDPGWHIYGNPKGPGPGLPTILEVISAPEGIVSNTARFLPAEKVVEPDLDASEWVWAYRGGTTVYIPLSIAKDVSQGSSQVQLRLQTVLCRKGICLPYKTDLTAQLDITGAPQGEILSQVLQEIQSTHVGHSKTTVTATPTDVAPFPEIKDLGDLSLGIPELHPRPVLRGLEVGSFLRAVLFSLLAGFILNFMPCVLPVVSLKILGFVQQAEGSRRRVALMGLSFSGGILAVFLTLAALASFAGHEWGELFQKQAFLVTMIALVFAMSLCLFGLFQLPIPHFAASGEQVSVQRQGYWESFYKGTLATFLATPCSGPLLGGAMAWTLRQPPLQIFTVFLCLGLGMAAPYMIMSLFPDTLRWLPRPGPWLIHFERLMGFALLTTVVYLLTILPEKMIIWVILFCLFLAIGMYVWGQMTTLSDSTKRRLVVRFVALVIIAFGGWLSFGLFPSAAQRGTIGGAESLHWQPYADMKLLTAFKEKRWVVVDFTADWCPNCILVERVVLNNPSVIDTFRKHNALLLRADLTRENPPAERLLEKLGSRSIPFLAMFPQGDQFWQPFFLRDIYRTEDVVQVFSKPVGD